MTADLKVWTAMGWGIRMKQREGKRLALQAVILKALAHPIRLAIIEFLAKGEKSVPGIVEYVGTSPSNISKHLSVMKNVGILSDRKVRIPVKISTKSC